MKVPERQTFQEYLREFLVVSFCIFKKSKIFPKNPQKIPKKFSKFLPVDFHTNPKNPQNSKNPKKSLKPFLKRLFSFDILWVLREILGVWGKDEDPAHERNLRNFWGNYLVNFYGIFGGGSGVFYPLWGEHHVQHPSCLQQNEPILDR